MRWELPLFLALVSLSLGYIWMKPSPEIERQKEKLQTPAETVESFKAKGPEQTSLADPLLEKMVKTTQILQQKDELRKELSVDPHQTPSAIMQAGQALGEIAELEKQHPERRDEFLSYYRNCFENEGTIAVTRVQCFLRYEISADLSEAEKEKALSSLPPNLQKLYRRFAANRSL